MLCCVVRKGNELGDSCRGCFDGCDGMMCAVTAGFGRLTMR